jgi:hypothetical protein
VGALRTLPSNAEQQVTPADHSVEQHADPVDLWAKFDPPTLPYGLLPDVIERFAFDRGRAMGADMAGVAMSALAVCAAAIPDKVELQVKQHDTGWRRLHGSGLHWSGGPAR